ncbi:NDR1/HIN1-like protein 13 [Curcuma longa]|uniref:NDR1/HIN1-like protein 13 n=1 Tax=Curcuma longa TaxID=136217 RepID=UPI003D9EBFEF
MAERVHPSQPPPESPRSSVSSGEAILPVRKPFPEPETHVINVPNGTVEAAKAPRWWRRRCCVCLLCFGAFVFLLAVTVGILFLAFRPRIPRYTIDGLSISSFDLTAFTVNPVFAVTVVADNRRNKRVGVYYRDGSDITAVYDGVTLCEGRWPTFYHPPRNETRFVTELRGSGIRLTAAVQSALVAAQMQGKVPLEVNVAVPIRIKFGAIRSWTIKVRVRCEVTVDGLRENAVVLDRRCRVKVKIFG